MDYKKILEGVVNIINTTEKSDIGFANICTYIGENCPEPRESEDESIRKALITFFQRFPYERIDAAGTNVKEAIAWLERQGSEPNWCHHKVDLSNCSEEYRKAYYDGWNNCNMQHSQCKSESNDVLKCLINGMKFYYEDNAEATWGTEKFSMKVKDILSWLEKQGNIDMGISDTTKQKLKDNLDNALEKETPKSWNEFLEKQGEQKPIESMPEFKEGDILYNEDSYASDSIFIFKGMSDKTNAYLCYARLYNKKDFSVYSKEDWDEGVGIYGGEFYPANHKQKELLFSEIEKAGYKWNPDEKKMEKIEQKHTFEMKTPEESLGVDSDTYNKIVDECVYGEQKPAWSEEDEAALGDALWCCKQAASIAKDENDMGNVWYAERWLNSLKDRVQPQPKREWSEEDDVAVKDICDKLNRLSMTYVGNESIVCQEEIKWLKSLRPQNTWKPSEEMLEALCRAIPENTMAISEDEMLLDKLYQGLKYGRVLSNK